MLIPNNAPVGVIEYENVNWLQAVGPVDEDDMALIETLGYVAPTNTSLTAGQICQLVEPTTAMKMNGRQVSRIWQVRFVISMWTYGAYRAALRLQQAGTWGQALAIAKGDVYTMLRDHNDVPPKMYKKAIVYAHSFPHGMYPDSAAWFYAKNLLPFTVLTNHEGWPLILDSAGAPYGGIDSPLHVTFDLAPDHYRKGSAIGRPFEFEDAAVHTMALFGYEEAMMLPVDPRSHRPLIER